MKIIIFFAVVLTFSLNGLGQTRHNKNQVANKSKKSLNVLKSQQSLELQEIKFYDVNENLISKAEFIKKLEDNNLAGQEFEKNGQPAAKLVANDKIGQFVAGETILNDDISQPPTVSPSKLLNTSISLQSLRGKTIVINFWFVGCRPCMSEIPSFNKIVNKYKDNKAIEFIALTFIGSHDKNGMSNLQAFLKKNEFDFQISVASNSALSSFAVKGYPTTIVLDKNGKIIFYYLYAFADSAVLLDKTLDAEMTKKY